MNYLKIGALSAEFKIEVLILYKNIQNWKDKIIKIWLNVLNNFYLNILRI